MHFERKEGKESSWIASVMRIHRNGKWGVGIGVVGENKERTE